LHFATNEQPGAVAHAAPPSPRSLETRLVEKLHETDKLDFVEVDNRYDCPICRRKVDAMRKTALHRLPASLLVTLQRTAYDETHQPYKVRVPVPIDAALTLTVNNHVVHYELAAVVLHDGRQMHEGHYTAYVRCRRKVGSADGFAFISDADVHECQSQEQTIRAHTVEAEGFLFLYNVISVK
jgi:ubiquitin C-terminal hydrolase